MERSEGRRDGGSEGGRDGGTGECRKEGQTNRDRWREGGTDKQTDMLLYRLH